MSREIQKDFKDLTSFFDNYSLRDLKDNHSLLATISHEHKKYFSFLTFIAELQAQHENQASPNTSVEQRDYLSESCSDIGNSIFVMIHGSYKASRMMLRSSIETFLKGFNADQIPGILKEKSMFELFNSVEQLPIFQMDPYKSLFHSIHAEYKELCKDIHTATRANMEHLTALEYFPAFNEGASRAISEICTRLTSNFLTLLCLKYHGAFMQMHHRNRENIIISVSRIYKPLILGI